MFRLRVGDVGIHGSENPARWDPICLLRRSFHLPEPKDLMPRANSGTAPSEKSYTSPPNLSEPARYLLGSLFACVRVASHADQLAWTRLHRSAAVGGRVALQ